MEPPTTASIGRWVVIVGPVSAAVLRQAQYFVIAFSVMVAAAQVSLERYQRWAPWFYLLGVGLLVAVIFVGVGAKGAQRWLSLGGFRFQPSEILKLVVPMTVAWYLAPRILPPLLIAASGLFVVFMAGIGWRYIFGAVLLAIASAWPAWVFVLKEYQKQRILTLLNPESDKLGAGWNIIQSKTAIGSGGWDGKGWMSGTQSQLDFLPESHTDFIIAVLAEEFGLRGVLVLLGLYVLILLRGFWIGLNAHSSYGRMLAGSLTLTFFVYIGRHPDGGLRPAHGDQHGETHCHPLIPPIPAPTSGAYNYETY